MTAHATEYCAASSDDAEDFQKVTASNWWDAALEYADENEHEIQDKLDDDAPDRAKVTVGVGHVRDPLRPSEILWKHFAARKLLEFITENHDDYQSESSEFWIEPRRNESVDAALKEMLAEVANAIRKHEDAACPRAWFHVDKAQDVTLGLAKSAAQAAALIDQTGKLQRHPIDGSLWLELDSPEATELGHAQELRAFDVWEAAQLCGVPFTDKPQYWRLSR